MWGREGREQWKPNFPAPYICLIACARSPTFRLIPTLNIWFGSMNGPNYAQKKHREDGCEYAIVPYPRVLAQLLLCFVPSIPSLNQEILLYTCTRGVLITTGPSCTWDSSNGLEMATIANTAKTADTRNAKTRLARFDKLCIVLLKKKKRWKDSNAGRKKMNSNNEWLTILELGCQSSSHKSILLCGPFAHLPHGTLVKQQLLHSLRVPNKSIIPHVTHSSLLHQSSSTTPFTHNINFKL